MKKANKGKSSFLPHPDKLAILLKHLCVLISPVKRGKIQSLRQREVREEEKETEKRRKTKWQRSAHQVVHQHLYCLSVERAHLVEGLNVILRRRIKERTKKRIDLSKIGSGDTYMKDKHTTNSVEKVKKTQRERKRRTRRKTERADGLRESLRHKVLRLLKLFLLLPMQFNGLRSSVRRKNKKERNPRQVTLSNNEKAPVDWRSWVPQRLARYHCWPSSGQDAQDCSYCLRRVQGLLQGFARRC